MDNFKYNVNTDKLFNATCFNPNEQCSFSTVLKNELRSSVDKQRAFNVACHDRRGVVADCCPLELINIAYQPGPYEIPFQIKNDGSIFTTCPEDIKAGCFREKEKDQSVCIQNACNDAGYRLASNFYEICKGQRVGSNLQPPEDCVAKKCWGNNFILNDLINKEKEFSLDTFSSDNLLRAQKKVEQDNTNLTVDLIEINEKINNPQPVYDMVTLTGQRDKILEKISDNEKYILYLKNLIKSADKYIGKKGDVGDIGDGYVDNNIGVGMGNGNGYVSGGVSGVNKYAINSWDNANNMYKPAPKIEVKNIGMIDGDVNTLKPDEAKKGAEVVASVVEEQEEKKTKLEKDNVDNVENMGGNEATIRIDAQNISASIPMKKKMSIALPPKTLIQNITSRGPEPFDVYDNVENGYSVENEYSVGNNCSVKYEFLHILMAILFIVLVVLMFLPFLVQE